LIKSAFVDLFNGLDVELVFALNILYVFFDFDEIRGQSRPSLGLQDGPEPDAARIDPNGG
jgi:hypothetical protein